MTELYTGNDAEFETTDQPSDLVLAKLALTDAITALDDPFSGMFYAPETDASKAQAALRAIARATTHLQRLS
jgi:hypothetical protein